MLWHSQCILEALHRLGILILRCKHTHRDLNTLSIIRIHHSRVHLCSSREDSARLGRQGNNLSQQQSARHPPTIIHPEEKDIYIPSHPNTSPNSPTSVFHYISPQSPSPILVPSAHYPADSPAPQRTPRASASSPPYPGDNPRGSRACRGRNPARRLGIGGKSRHEQEYQHLGELDR